MIEIAAQDLGAPLRTYSGGSISPRYQPVAIVKGLQVSGDWAVDATTRAKVQA